MISSQDGGGAMLVDLGEPVNDPPPDSRYYGTTIRTLSEDDTFGVLSRKSANQGDGDTHNNNPNTGRLYIIHESHVCSMQ